MRIWRGWLKSDFSAASPSRRRRRRWAYRRPPSSADGRSRKHGWRASSTRGVSVDPSEWARAREVFDAALARERGERSAFLDEACEGNLALRAEVASLLAAHDRSGDFIERPVFEAAADLLVESLDGRLIGPYIVRHEIGR